MRPGGPEATTYEFSGADHDLYRPGLEPVGPRWLRRRSLAIISVMC